MANGEACLVLEKSNDWLFAIKQNLMIGQNMATMLEIGLIPVNLFSILIG